MYTQNEEKVKYIYKVRSTSLSLSRSFFAKYIYIEHIVNRKSQRQRVAQRDHIVRIYDDDVVVCVCVCVYKLCM